MKEATCRAVTGKRGACERVLKNVETAKDLGLPIFLKFIVLKDNIEDVGTFRKWAQELGIEYDIASAIHPGVYGGKKHLHHRVEVVDYVGLEMEKPHFYMGWENSINSLPPDTKTCDKRLFRCNAGKNIFLISADCFVHPCVLHRQNKWSLRKELFINIWGQMGKLCELVRENQLQCDSCKHRTVCSVCPAWSALEQEDPEVPLNFLCEAAKQIKSWIEKDKQNERKKRVDSECGHYGSEPNAKRTRSDGGAISKSRRQLLQEGTPMRSCNPKGTEVVLSSDTIVSRDESFILRQIGDINILIPDATNMLKKNNVIGLNADAMKIFAILLAPIKIGSLLMELSELGFQISHENLNQFLAQLVEAGVLDAI